MKIMIFKNYWKLHLAFVFFYWNCYLNKTVLLRGKHCVRVLLSNNSIQLSRTVHLLGERPFLFFMFLLCLFTLQVKDLLISLCFLLLSFFFPWTAFIFQEILKHVFLNVADHLPFKVMAPNNPLPNNTQNLQSYCTLCIKWLLLLLL